MGILIIVPLSLSLRDNIPLTPVNNPMDIIDKYYEHQYDEELALSTLDAEERKKYEQPWLVQLKRMHRFWTSPAVRAASAARAKEYRELLNKIRKATP